jgi:leucyl-tRNA synthetase
MDTFVDSSWYYLRYTDSRNEHTFADKAKMSALLPVDMYLIGPEHIVLHLLYSRFFTKFLRDEGYLSFDEPFIKMRHQGMILGPDGKKMSKSKGNVITPDEIIEKYGADTLRVYEMFMGPLESDKPWDTGSVIGVYRFLQRIYQLFHTGITNDTSLELDAKLHLTIKKVTEDIPELKFNTAISALMIFINEWEESIKKAKIGVSAENAKSFLKIIAPFAPFMSEEIYHSTTLSAKNLKESIHYEKWPKYDPKLLLTQRVKVVIQVNGKLRSQIEISSDEMNNEDGVVAKALSEPQVAKWLDGKKLMKTIYVPGKVLNLVVA